MHPLPLLGTETPTPPNLLLILLEASPTPRGDGKKGFPGHWTGKSFFVHLIEIMILFFTFTAGHPLARSFFIAAIFAIKIIFKNFSINPEFSPSGDES